MDGPFAAYLPLLMFVPFFVFLVVSSRRRPDCPECGRARPAFQSPFAKTWRRWVEGGYRCPACGCEADLAGRMVDAGTGPRRGSVLRGVLLLTPLFLGIAAGIYFLVWGTPGAVAPPVVPAPPARHGG